MRVPDDHREIVRVSALGPLHSFEVVAPDDTAVYFEPTQSPPKLILRVEGPDRVLDPDTNGCPDGKLHPSQIQVSATAAYQQCALLLSKQQLQPEEAAVKVDRTVQVVGVDDD